MIIRVKGFGSFEYKKVCIESPKMYGYMSKTIGFTVSTWSKGPYNGMIKVLKLNK